MILPDTNLLLYAIDRLCPDHDRAARWWETALQANEPVLLCPVVVFAFLRLSTHPRVFENPLRPNEAFDYIENWLAFPSVAWGEPGPGHLARVKALLLATGTGGNLVTDAQIAALAAEHDATIYSADADFSRFPNIRWTNPLREASSRGRGR